MATPNTIVGVIRFNQKENTRLRHSWFVWYGGRKNESEPLSAPYVG
jgi:hypothetical protein